MPTFKVVYQDGSVATKKKVTISVDRGSIAEGITDSRGFVSISTSNNYGKIIINGKTVYSGSLNISEVCIK